MLVGLLSLQALINMFNFQLLFYEQLAITNIIKDNKAIQQRRSTKLICPSVPAAEKINMIPNTFA